jgi:peroxiredoxin
MAGAPEVGQLVPDFDLPTASGESVSLSENLGERNVVLVFFRAWW